MDAAAIAPFPVRPPQLLLGQHFLDHNGACNGPAAAGKAGLVPRKGATGVTPAGGAGEADGRPRRRKGSLVPTHHAEDDHAHAHMHTRAELGPVNGKAGE